MDQLKFLTHKLNSDPFCLNLRLVDLDGQSAGQRIQLLNQVFGKLGFEVDEASLLIESKEDRSQRISQYLAYIKYDNAALKVSPSGGVFEQSHEGSESAHRSSERLLDELVEGGKEAVFDVLYWIFSDFDRLCKRAYLSKFLAPFALPTEVSASYFGQGTDNSRANLARLLDEYKELQIVFKEVHMERECLKTKNMELVDHRSQARLLEKEREQLQEKIQQLRENAKEKKGFAELLQAISLMRKEKEKQAKLSTILIEQKKLLQEAESRISDNHKRLQTLKGSIISGDNEASFDCIMNILQKDIDEKEEILHVKLMTSTVDLQEKLESLKREKLEPIPTLDDIEHAKAAVATLKTEVREKEAKAEALKNTQNNSQLDMYRKQFKLIFEQVSMKEIELKNKQDEVERIRVIVQQLQSQKRGGLTGTNDFERSNDRQLSREGHINDVQGRRVDQHFPSRLEIAAIQNEVTILKQTEDILCCRFNELKAQLESKETKFGVRGYLDTQTHLEQTSEKIAQLDEGKTQSLREISGIIQTILNELKGRKNSIKPLMKTLHNARREFQDVQGNYNARKEKYEKYKKGYNADLKELENNCNFNSDELIAANRRYHYLTALCEISEVNLKRTHLEERCQHSEEHFLADFSTIEHLYQNMFVQQNNIVNKLRARERNLSENEHEFRRQKIFFSDLHKFLACKHASQKEKAAVQKKKYSENDVVDFGNAQVLLCN